MTAIRRQFSSTMLQALVVCGFVLQVHGQATMIPNEMTDAMESGHNLRLSIKEKDESLQNCTLILGTFGDVIDLVINGVISTSPQDDVQYWGSTGNNDCGALVKNVTTPYDGVTWTLRATSDNYTVLLADLYIKVQEVQEDIESEGTNTLHLGPDGLSLDQKPIGKYYQTTNPVGVVHPVQTSNNFKIPVVTYEDEGTWKFAYGVKGRVQERIGTVPVSVIDVSDDMDIINSTTDGEINLLCRKINVGAKADYCRFVRPDGTGLSMSSGIGNDDYSYFGDGLNTAVYYDCGITIHKPKDGVNNGIWQCVIGLDNEEKDGGFYSLATGKAALITQNITTVNSTVVGLKDREVYLQCHAPAKLTACWFQFSDGKMFAPDPKSQSKPYPNEDSISSIKYTYYGDGLHLGDCGIMFEWSGKEEINEDVTCNIVIEDHEEVDLQTTISLRITDNRLSANDTLVESGTEESAILICHSTIRNAALEYCRFVRPDGKGITVAVGNKNTTAKSLSRYSYHGAGLLKGECGINIDSVSDEDFGDWFCAAKLLDGENPVEANIVITLESTDLTVGAIVGIAVGSIALLCILIGGGYFIFRKSKK